RLCAEASGGQVLVGGAAAHLARGRSGHLLRYLGDRLLRGFDEGVDVYELLWRNNEATSLPRALKATTAPLVGRDAEVRGGESLLDAAAAGESGVLLIVGEPGVGKTRLAAELAQRALSREFVVLYGHCSESSAPPYQPMVEALGAWLLRCP